MRKHDRSRRGTRMRIFVIGYRRGFASSWPFRRIFSCKSTLRIPAKSRDDGWRDVISALFLSKSPSSLYSFCSFHDLSFVVRFLYLSLHRGFISRGKIRYPYSLYGDSTRKLARLILFFMKGRPILDVKVLRVYQMLITNGEWFVLSLN